MPDPPLHSDRNLAPPPQVRARHQGADPGEAAQVHRVRRDRVPGPGSGSGSQSGSPARSEASVGARSVRSAAVSVGSIEVLSGDQASEGEHDMSYSTDEADVSQGSIPLLDISASDDDETRKRKARESARRSDTAYAAWKEKQTSDGIKGIEEWDQMVNDYMDGKRRPKNPDPLGPPFPTWRNAGCFSHWPL